MLDWRVELSRRRVGWTCDPKEAGGERIGLDTKRENVRICNLDLLLHGFGYGVRAKWNRNVSSSQLPLS